jgi:hypothetical protein
VKAHVIAAAVFAVAAYFAVKKKGKLTCGPGSTFVAMTLDEAQQRWGKYAAWAQIADQVRKYGGTCTKSGTVADAGSRPLEQDAMTDTAGGVVDPDAQDSVLITHPWQLL